MIQVLHGWWSTIVWNFSICRNSCHWCKIQCAHYYNGLCWRALAPTYLNRCHPLRCKIGPEQERWIIMSLFETDKVDEEKRESIYVSVYGGSEVNNVSTGTSKQDGLGFNTSQWLLTAPCSMPKSNLTAQLYVWQLVPRCSTCTKQLSEPRDSVFEMQTFYICSNLTSDSNLKFLL